MTAVNPTVWDINITAANMAAGVPFSPKPNTADDQRGTEISTSIDSVFAGSSIELQWYNEATSKWHNTGVIFTGLGAKIVRMRAGVTYRFIGASVATVNVFFSFHGS